ncbi:hypothetical protein AAFF_G00329930 [Aldrovandia affinis]|uniref:Serine/threonine-protein kinase 40 n=1 Tax=Aldrovandia affinis TaxID=143900 RepID=A0AAD7WQ16_9TELE|nr:hypothetical protein AAFF_G00329930 [Aldrovandia affinis]
MWKRSFPRLFWVKSKTRMSKRRISERGAGESSARASKLLCTGISGNNGKRAGPFILGPRLGNSPVQSIVQCLARKDGTDDFYQLKILTLEERADAGAETQEERQGKMLLHTEYSLLSLLHNQDGVVHHHGLFQDRAYEIVEDLDSNKVRKMKKRICLVLDCLCAHDFSDKTADLINLQHYVIKEKRLSERETIVIFYDVVRVVEALHKAGLFFGKGGTCTRLPPGSRDSVGRMVARAMTQPTPETVSLTRGGSGSLARQGKASDRDL